jgi:hypothetical protein
MARGVRTMQAGSGITLVGHSSLVTPKEPHRPSATILFSSFVGVELKSSVQSLLLLLCPSQHYLS